MNLNQPSAIVLIEIDEVTLELYQRELRKSFTVFGFTEIDDILDTITNQDIRAVVIEPEIQSGKGWGLIQTINNKFSTRHIPIIVCSTREPGSTHIPIEVTKYLTKPVLPKTLREKTIEAIYQQKEIRELHD
jgi:DNA-binding response OmpR family regulator